MKTELEVLEQKTYNKRLLKLAAFLEELPPHRFEFSSWVGADWKGLEDLSCGTTACALGWATTIPEFKEMGLYLTDENGIGCKEPSGTTMSVQQAAQYIFGVNYFEFDLLFLPMKNNLLSSMPKNLSENATAVEVAANIRAFVATKS